LIRCHIIRHQPVEVFPPEGYRFGVHFLDAPEDALAQFLQRADPDVPQEGAGHLRERDLDQVQPRGVHRRVHVLEAARPGGQAFPGLPRDVRGVAVQDNADGRAFRAVGIQALQESDELPAAVPFPDAGDDLPAVQVQCSQDRQGAMAPVLAVPGRLPMPAGYLRQRQAPFMVQQDLRPLHFTYRRRLRPRKRAQHRPQAFPSFVPSWPPSVVRERRPQAKTTVMSMHSCYSVLDDSKLFLEDPPDPLHQPAER